MKKFGVWLTVLCLLLAFAVGFAACAPQEPAETAEYTVTFDSVGGSAVASQTLGEGEKVAKPTDPEKEGSVFAGWWKDAGYTAEWDFREDTVTGNITLYAKWDAIRYTVTYETDNGTYLAPEQLPLGSAVTAVPEKNGYDFAGWFTDADRTEAWSGTVQGDTTLYAKWERSAPRAVNVVKEFDINNSAEVQLKNGLTLFGDAVDGFNNNPSGVIELIVNLEEGGAYALVAEASKEWMDNPTTQFTVTVNGVQLDQRMICTGTGNWDTYRAVAPVNVELKAGANTIAIGADPALENDASVARLRGFKLLDDSLRYTYLPTPVYYGDFELEGAQVSDEEGKNYYAGDFSAEGSSFAFPVSVLEETEVDLTVYASHLSGEPFSFDVFVDGEAAASVSVPQTVVSGRDGGFRATEPARLRLAAGEHTVLLQRSAASAGETNVQFVVLSAAAGEALDPEQTYIVRFDSLGGSTVSAQQVEEGGLVQEPAAPVKDGNVFGGWFKDPACTQAWDFAADTVTADTTLYAKWTESVTPPDPEGKVTVTFDSMGGSAVPSQQVEAGALLQIPAQPTKAGNAFGGWYKDPACTQAWNFFEDTVAESMTLYAKWEPESAEEPEGPEEVGVYKTFDVGNTEEVELSGSLSQNGTEIDGFADSNAGVVTLHVTVPAAGEYALVAEAAKEWNDNPVSRLQITVNGTVVDTPLVCTGTGSWGEYRAVNPVNLMLQAGENVITIGRTPGLGDDESGCKLRNIRLLDGAVEYTRLPAVQYYGSFALEGASAQPGDKPYYAGDFAADGSSLSFDVDLLEAQDVSMTVFASHTTEDPFRFEIYVDGVRVGSLLVQQTTVSGRNGGFAAMGPVVLSLAAGEHTVTLRKAEGSLGETRVQAVLLAEATGSEPAPAEGYFVRFESNGGSEVATVIVMEGEKVAKPADPTLLGSTFGGWYKDKDCEQPWDFAADTVTADMVLYAKWEQSTTAAVGVYKTFDVGNTEEVELSGSLSQNGTEIDGFANGDAGVVTLHVTVENAGGYALVAEAAKEWNDNPVSRLQITVNGTVVDTPLVCTGTGSWGEYRAVNPVNLTLQAGENVITIGRTPGLGDDESGCKLRNIRLLDGAVEYTRLPAVQYYGSFALEGASAQPGDKPYYAGDFAADGSSLSFEVYLLEAQSVDLTVFASHQDADDFAFEVYVDDVKVDGEIAVTQTQSPVGNRTGGFAAMEAFTVELEAGAHTIRLQKADGSDGETCVQAILLTAAA